LGRVEPLSGLIGDVAVLVAEAVSRGGREIAHGAGGLRDRRGAMRGQLAEELLDRLAALAGPLLDLADELIDVAALDLEVVIGQLAPLLLDLTPDLVPLALKF